MALNPSTKEKLIHLAEKLGKAWLECGQIENLLMEDLPVTRSEAYFVQDKMAETINQPMSGWKVGATSAKMRELDGHDDVVPGRIFRNVTFKGSSHQLPIARFADARAETEFAFRLLEGIPLREIPWTGDELKSKVELHPAVELIGNRHQLPNGSKSQKSLMTIADNGGGIGFVFGDPISNWNEVDFRQHHIRLQVDESPPAENFLGEMRCFPLEALAQLVDHLSERGFVLNEGDFVSTGAATVPQPFNKNSTVIADFGELGCIDLKFS